MKGYSFQKCTTVIWVNSKLLTLVYRNQNKPTAFDPKASSLAERAPRMITTGIEKHIYIAHSCA